MGIKKTLKYAIIKKSIEKKKKKAPFDSEYSEHFTLPANADLSQNNSYYFSAHGLDGESLLFRQGNRGGGNTEVWFAYKDKDGQSYVNTMQLYESNNPTSVHCAKTEQLWQFSYNGLMALTDKDNNLTSNPTNQVIETSFVGEFIANSPIFEFSRHMDSKPIARALSNEKWTEDFKTSVAHNHQVHYEQPGVVKGTLQLGKKKIEINMPAMRDHSYGKRDWSYMDRHIWLMIILEGDEHLNINMVRYPALRQLQSGYLKKGESTICIDSVTSMDDIPCNGIVPKQFKVEVIMADGTKLNVECTKEQEYIFPFANGAYVINEGLGSFKIGEKKGRGILEFGFNGNKNRWTR